MKKMESSDKYNDFLADVVKAMLKHGVKDVLILSHFKGQVRNTTLYDNGNTEKVFDILSDQLNEYFLFMEGKSI